MAKTTSANPFEQIADPELEAQQIKEIEQLTIARLLQRYPEPNRILRGVHPKSHGCVKATFTIHPDLDSSLRVGIFAKPGQGYDAWVRFSNAAVLVEHDLKDAQNGSRGMAIKVFFGDDGREVLIPGAPKEQDFLMINTPAFAFANVEDYLRLTQVIHQNHDNADLFFAPLARPDLFPPDVVARASQSLAVVHEILAKPVANPLEVQYFGAAPFLFGPDRVMRFSAVPAGGEVPQVLPNPATENYLKEALVARMKQSEEVVFDFMVQVRAAGEAGLNIEDATTRWDESQFPFQKVATLTIHAPQPNIATAEFEEICEKLFFTPWHGLAAHQPLGGINRLRKAIYQASADRRAKSV